MVTARDLKLKRDVEVNNPVLVRMRNGGHGIRGTSAESGVKVFKIVSKAFVASWRGARDDRVPPPKAPRAPKKKASPVYGLPGLFRERNKASPAYGLPKLFKEKQRVSPPYGLPKLFKEPKCNAVNPGPPCDEGYYEATRPNGARCCYKKTNQKQRVRRIGKKRRA